MKKINEVMRMFEPCDARNSSVYCKICTAGVESFLVGNDFDNDYRSYTVHEIVRKCIYGNRYRGLFVVENILFMAEYTVNEWHNGKPMCYEDVVDIELPEIEEIILPFSEWNTKGLSPDEYLLREVNSYKEKRKSDCVYLFSSGKTGELNFAFAILFDEKKQKYCDVSFAHFPII